MNLFEGTWEFEGTGMGEIVLNLRTGELVFGPLVFDGDLGTVWPSPHRKPEVENRTGAAGKNSPVCPCTVRARVYI